MKCWVWVYSHQWTAGRTVRYCVLICNNHRVAASPTDTSLPVAQPMSPLAQSCHFACGSNSGGDCGWEKRWIVFCAHIFPAEKQEPRDNKYPHSWGGPTLFLKWLDSDKAHLLFRKRGEKFPWEKHSCLYLVFSCWTASTDLFFHSTLLLRPYYVPGTVL